MVPETRALLWDRLPWPDRVAVARTCRVLAAELRTHSLSIPHEWRLTSLQAKSPSVIRAWLHLVYLLKRFRIDVLLPHKPSRRHNYFTRADDHWRLVCRSRGELRRPCCPGVVEGLCAGGGTAVAYARWLSKPDKQWPIYDITFAATATGEELAVSTWHPCTQAGAGRCEASIQRIIRMLAASECQ
jgi:hypothetical protein